MVDSRYTYAVARIRAIETRLLSPQDVERLLGEDAPGIIRFLKESDYADSFRDITDPWDFESALILEMDKTLTLLENLSADLELIQLFRLRYDFHNLQTLLKAKYLNESYENSLIGLGLLDIEKLKDAVSEDETKELPDPIAEGFRQAVAVYQEKKHPRLISLTLDRFMWRHFLEIADTYQNLFLRELFQLWIDLINIRIFLRLKGHGDGMELLQAALIPGGSVEINFFLYAFEEPWEVFLRQIRPDRFVALLEDSLTTWPQDKPLWRFEVAADNFILKILEQTKLIFFGVEPLIAYLLYKENEIKLLRTLIVGKLNGVPSERLKERFRAIYV